MLTALPQTVSLSYSEIANALEKSLTKIDAALMKVLESMPPEPVSYTHLFVASLMPAMPLPCAKQASAEHREKIMKIALFFIVQVVW